LASILIFVDFVVLTYHLFSSIESFYFGMTLGALNWNSKPVKLGYTATWPAVCRRIGTFSANQGHRSTILKWLAPSKSARHSQRTLRRREVTWPKAVECKNSSYCVPAYEPVEQSATIEYTYCSNVLFSIKWVVTCFVYMFGNCPSSYCNPYLKVKTQFYTEANNFKCLTLYKGLVSEFSGTIFLTVFVECVSSRSNSFAVVRLSVKIKKCYT
jgi:hypothetical protein